MLPSLFMAKNAITVEDLLQLTSAEMAKMTDEELKSVAQTSRRLAQRRLAGLRKLEREMGVPEGYSGITSSKNLYKGDLDLGIPGHREEARKQILSSRSLLERSTSTVSGARSYRAAYYGEGDSVNVDPGRHRQRRLTDKQMWDLYHDMGQIGRDSSGQPVEISDEQLAGKGLDSETRIRLIRTMRARGLKIEEIRTELGKVVSERYAATERSFDSIHSDPAEVSR